MAAAVTRQLPSQRFPGPPPLAPSEGAWRCGNGVSPIVNLVRVRENGPLAVHADLLVDAALAVHLHRAGIDAARLGQDRGARVPLGEERADAVPGQEYRCGEAHRAAAELLDDRPQQLAVDFVEAVAIDFQHLQGRFGGGLIDFPSGADLGVVADVHGALLVRRGVAGDGAGCGGQRAHDVVEQARAGALERKRAALGTDLSEVTTGSAQYVPGFVFAPYPNAFRAPFHKGPGPYDDGMYIDFIEDWLLVHQVEPERAVVAVLEEVVDAHLLEQPADEVEVGLVVLDAVVELRGRRGRGRAACARRRRDRCRRGCARW